MNYQRFLVDENLSDNFFLKGEADKLCNVRSANHRTIKKIRYRYPENYTLSRFALQNKNID